MRMINIVLALRIMQTMCMAHSPQLRKMLLQGMKQVAVDGSKVQMAITQKTVGTIGAYCGTALLTVTTL